MKKRTNAEGDHLWCCCHGGSFWGWCFLIFGLIFLLGDLNILPSGVSFWPIVLIALGIYFLVRKRQR